MVHGCWQLDVNERVPLPGYGLAHILDLVDHHSGLKLAAVPFPAQEPRDRVRVTWAQYRQALRAAFSRWGLPDRIRTDRDHALVAKDDYPFPMAATLWLVGLGIEHELIRRVTQNGGVERTHRTWEARLAGYGPFELLAEWHELLDYERWRMNAILPSRGRNCQRHPPLLVYPEARQPRCFYRLEDELALFDEQRVQAYRAQGSWLRRTADKGRFSLGGHYVNLTTAYRQRWVRITYRCCAVGFQATCPPEPTVLKTFQLPGLSAADLTGLE